MTNPLHVLIVEDRPEDAELMVYELRRAGFEPDWQRVDTEPDYLAHLHEGVDLILADHSLPEFDAPRVLHLLQERNLDIPVIIVTGSISEEVAVERMKQGASDYLLKDRLVRLGQAAIQALEQKKLRDEKRLAEAAQRRLIVIIEATTDLIATADVEGRMLYLNHAGRKILGFGTNEDVVGYPILETHPVPMRSLIQDEAIPAAIRDGVWESETLFLSRDGREIPVSQVILAHKTANGDVEFLSTVARDISERKQAEESLRRYNQRLETLHAIDRAILAAESPETIAQLVLKHILQQMAASGASVTMFDFATHEGIVLAAYSKSDSQWATGIGFPLDAFPSDYFEGMQKGRIHVVENINTPPQPPVEMEFLQTSSLLTYVRIPLLSQEELIGTFVLASEQANTFTPEHIEIAHEIADQLAIAIQQARLREQIRRHVAGLEERVLERTLQLRRAKERVETILNNISDALVSTSLDGIIEQTNPAFNDLFGYSEDELFGHSVSTLVGFDYADQLLEILHIVVNDGQARRVEILAQRKDGLMLEADIALAPVIDAGQIQSVVCSLRDISERKRMEKELREALEKQKELNEMKSGFVSMVSHEFRTPLTVILSSSQIMRRYSERLSEERKVLQLDKIDVQVQRLTALLEDVLTLSKAETMGLEFHPVQLDLEAFCREVVEEIQVITGAPHQIDFSTDGLCTRFAGDERLLRHIITNLLTNAIKYSPQGSKLELDLVCVDGQAVLSVKDQGIGIPEADQKRLFESFRRAGNVGNIPGTGLGLVIIKRAVEAHGGTITFDSQVGVGTTFTVHLPLPPSET